MQRFFGSPGQKIASHLRTHFYFQIVQAYDPIREFGGLCVHGVVNIAADRLLVPKAEWYTYDNGALAPRLAYAANSALAALEKAGTATGGYAATGRTEGTYAKHRSKPIG